MYIYNNILLIWKNKNNLALYDRYLEYQKQIPNYYDIENRACMFRKAYEAFTFLEKYNSTITTIGKWRFKTFRISNKLDCKISNYEDLNKYIGEDEAPGVLGLTIYFSNYPIPKCLEKYFTNGDIVKLEKEFGKQIVFDDTLYT